MEKAELKILLFVLSHYPRVNLSFFDRSYPYNVSTPFEFNYKKFK